MRCFSGLRFTSSLSATHLLLVRPLRVPYCAHNDDDDDSSSPSLTWEKSTATRSLRGESFNKFNICSTHRHLELFVLLRPSHWKSEPSISSIYLGETLPCLHRPDLIVPPTYDLFGLPPLQNKTDPNLDPPPRRRSILNIYPGYSHSFLSFHRQNARSNRAQRKLAQRRRRQLASPSLDTRHLKEPAFATVSINGCSSSKAASPHHHLRLEDDSTALRCAIGPTSSHHHHRIFFLSRNSRNPVTLRHVREAFQLERHCWQFSPGTDVIFKRSLVTRVCARGYSHTMSPLSRRPGTVSAKWKRPGLCAFQRLSSVDFLH